MQCNMPSPLDYFAALVADDDSLSLTEAAVAIAQADEHGYGVAFIGQNGRVHATPGRCPVLLWVEHTPNDAEADLPAAIREAGLAGLQEAHLSVHRSATGLIVRADAD